MRPIFCDVKSVFPQDKTQISTVKKLLIENKF